jgi:pilus assembly protein Flp/PilA
LINPFYKPGINFSREAKMLFAPKEKGQGLVEYALILVFVALIVIVVLAILGPAIGNAFSQVVEGI